MVSATPYCCSLTDDDRPTDQLLQAVSSLVDAGHGELKPLHTAIDPDTVNTMVSAGTEGSTSFEYEGFHVTVHGDGRLILRNPESVHTTLNTASNVLLVAPRPDETDLCGDLCHPYPAAHENILSVTVEQTVDEKVNEWDAQDQEMPAHRKIISLGSFARSAGTQTVTLPNAIQADLIADTHDLTTLQRRIDDTIATWQSTPQKTVLCFHAVDALLRETDLETTYRYLYHLTARIATSDVLAHYHLDPLQCDTREVTALTPLFDAIVSEDGVQTDSLAN